MTGRVQISTEIALSKNENIRVINSFLEKSVSSGIYFYKMKTGDFKKVRKMILLR